MWRPRSSCWERPAQLLGGRRGLFFQRKRPRLFGIEGLESPRDFPRLAGQAIQAAKQNLNGAADLPPLSLVRALDDASNGLCRIADAAELCRNVHPGEKYVAAAHEAVQAVSAYMGEVNLNLPLYQGMRRGESSADFAEMPLEARAVLRHMRVSMEHEGIHLPEAEKAECLQLLEQEQQLAFDIVQNQERQRRTADGEGLWAPADALREGLGEQAGQLPRRTSSRGEELLIPADIVGDWVLKTVSCAETRRRVHESQQATEGGGDEDMAELLRVRQRLAGLRGYQTWSWYALREGLMSSPDGVQRFLDAAWEQLRPGIASDLRLLAAEKERLGLGPPRLQPWDVPLLLHRCKSQSEVSEYLTFGSLMRAVDLILSQLLGLAFVQEEPATGEVWHPSVLKYTLRQAGNVVGVLYLDPFMRPGKVVQSAQFTLQGSKELSDGLRQIPSTALVYSLPPGDSGMSLWQATTFMHEIGHAAHSLLSETTFQHLSGTRGAVDFAEFPSHLFEHFVLDPRCLSSYAAHPQTGALMPPTVAAGLAGPSQFAHFEAAQQLLYAVLDQAFYSLVPAADGDRRQGAEEVQRHLASVLARFDRELEGPFDGPFTELLGLTRPSKFDHLVHYGGSYYCYLFNRALSAHVWDRGFREDPFGSVPGERLRGLLRGGSVVQSIDAILELCPGAERFEAEEVPFGALARQLEGSPH